MYVHKPITSMNLCAVDMFATNPRMEWFFAMTPCTEVIIAVNPLHGSIDKWKHMLGPCMLSRCARTMFAMGSCVDNILTVNLTRIPELLLWFVRDGTHQCYESTRIICCCYGSMRNIRACHESMRGIFETFVWLLLSVYFCFSPANAGENPACDQSLHTFHACFETLPNEYFLAMNPCFDVFLVNCPSANDC